MTNPLRSRIRKKRRLSSALLLIFGYYLASGWFALAHQAQHHHNEVSEQLGHHSCHHVDTLSDETNGMALSDSPDHEHCYICALTLLVPSPMDLWSGESTVDLSVEGENSEFTALPISSRGYAHSGRAPPVKNI